MSRMRAETFDPGARGVLHGSRPGARGPDAVAGRPEPVKPVEVETAVPAGARTRTA